MCGDTGTPRRGSKTPCSPVGTPRPPVTSRPSLPGNLIRAEPPTCWAYAKRRGRAREADSAWALIPPDSPFRGRAVASRMDLLIEQGRLADAEHLIERACEMSGYEASALRMLLIPIFIQEGREKEAERLIESRWQSLKAKGEGASEQAINLARLHMELRWNVPPTDAIRAYLDQAGKSEPKDDRIWLGRANLAIRVGSFDEAARWVNACLGLRPDDQSVWRARLDWAMSTGRSAEAQTALKHLPSQPTTPAELHRLSAWLAGACGDMKSQRRELAALIAEAPEDFEALERLESLEKTDAAKTGVIESRHRRDEIESAGPDTGSSIGAINPPATPRKWPAWQHGWATTSKRSSF